MREKSDARDDGPQDGKILRSLLENLDHLALILLDEQRSIVAWNRGAERLLGWSADEAVGQSADILFSEAEKRAGVPESEVQIALERGKAIHQSEVAQKGGGFLRGRAVVQPLYEKGRLTGYVKTIEESAEREKDDLDQSFLQASADLLTSSLDYETTLFSLAQLVVPRLADWCVIHLVNAAGELELATVSHADPERALFARDASRNYPPRPDSPSGPASVIRSGKAEWIEEISEDMVRAAARDEEHYRILSEAKMTSYLCVPLIARGNAIGAITFVGAESGHRYTAAHLPLVEELSRRAAIAVDNARLYRLAQTEIQERLRAEKALAESRDYYRALTETLPQLVWTTAPDGVPDSFNQNWFDYTGQKPDDTGSWWKGGVHPDDQARTMVAWKTAVQTGEPYEIEYRLKGGDGAYRWFLTRGLPLKNPEGDIIKWFGTCTLIEDQKRAEQTQRFLAELSQTIRPLKNPTEVLGAVVTALGQHLSATHCAYADIDEEKSQFISRANYDWKGVSTAGVYPLNFFGEEIIAALQAAQTFIVNDTQTDSRIAHRYAASYQPFDIRAFIVAPLIKEGRWIATLSVTMHGRARFWTKDEIDLVEKALELIWLAVENARLFLAERERSEQLALAISEIHHRTKNNLQAVGALLEVRIPDGETVMSVEAVRDSLSQIKTIALVHDLLSKDDPMGRVDAAAVLTNLGWLLSSGLRAGDSPLSIQVDAEPVQMPTRLATSLALVVNELLTNAVKHSAAQSVRNSGESALAPSIRVQMRRQAEDIVVAVSDKGAGFPPGFDPAMNAHIGLQVVETLVVHDLCGRVLFGNETQENSNQVTGACVEIVFPLSRLAEE